MLRVSRANLGVDALNRLAARYVGAVESRHARLTGEQPDLRRADRLASLSGPSTSAPGTQPSVRVDVQIEGRPGFVKRMWGKVTTPALRAVARAARLGFKVAKFLLGRQGRAAKTWAINRRMIATGIRIGADVYHSHDLNTLWVGHRCKQAVPGSVLVYDSHELATERNRMGFWWRIWATWNERRWLPSADALIVASPSWIDILRRKHGSVPSVCATVLNVPERRPVRPVDLRSMLGLPDSAKIVLYQGSIQENRGIEPAIEAVAMLSDAHLVVVGYGHHRPRLEAMVERAGLDHKVSFIGPIPHHELLDYTAGADVGLCNIVNSSLSYYTSLPNKLFEYFMAGIPVIGSDSPEIGRVIRETGAGEVCPPDDPRQIADAIRRILENPEPYRKAAREAAEVYNWTVERDRLLEAYRQLLA